MNRPVATLASALLVVAGMLSACSDATSPSPNPRVEGSYAATIFTTTTAGGTIDRIAEGLSLTITLKSDGTTEGSVTAEGATVPVAGTWDTTQNVVHFHQETANFLRQIPFRVRPNQLLGDTTLGVTRFRVTLTKGTSP